MITAEVEQDFDVENEPVMVGYNSSNSVSSWENHFISYGPYDMDGDGMTDVQEKENGTDPYSGAVKYPTVKAEYGKVGGCGLFIGHYRLKPLDDAPQSLNHRTSR